VRAFFPGTDVARTACPLQPDWAGAQRRAALQHPARDPRHLNAPSDTPLAIDKWKTLPAR